MPSRLRGDGDRRRDAFADVNDVRVEAARRQEPAEGDELGRQRVHVSAATASSAAAAAPATRRRARAALARCRRAAASAAAALATIMSCCVRWLPIVTTSTNVVPSAPTMAPSVFAAYSRPTARRGSSPAATAAASASGKLAPQSSAAGKATTLARSRSSCSATAAVVGSVTSIGQYGSDSCERIRGGRDRKAEQRLAVRQAPSSDRSVCRWRLPRHCRARSRARKRPRSRERVDGAAEQQREMARPEHFGRQRRHARQRRHEVDPARAAAAVHCARRIDRCRDSTAPRCGARAPRQPPRLPTFSATATNVATYAS